MKVNCNAVEMKTNEEGYYGKLKTWYLPGGIVNILSMHELEQLCHNTYDS